MSSDESPPHTPTSTEDRVLKISDLIRKLQLIKKRYGNVEVHHVVFGNIESVSDVNVQVVSSEFDEDEMIPIALID